MSDETKQLVMFWLDEEGLKPAVTEMTPPPPGAEWVVQVKVGSGHTLTIVQPSGTDQIRIQGGLVCRSNTPKPSPLLETKTELRSWRHCNGTRSSLASPTQALVLLWRP